ncbi:MAG TPA: hypothetical protein PKL88_02290 [bacterium]|nr:hypothetical protein [bacterium]
MKQETNEQLLIRIDERQKEMSKKLDSMSKKLDKVVMEEDCDKRQNYYCSEMETVKRDIDDFKALKNKLIGWIAGVAVVGGSAGGLIVKGISQVLAYYQ